MPKTGSYSYITRNYSYATEAAALCLNESSTKNVPLLLLVIHRASYQSFLTAWIKTIAECLKQERFFNTAVNKLLSILLVVSDTLLIETAHLLQSIEIF